MPSSIEAGVCTVRVEAGQDPVVFIVQRVSFPSHGFRPNRTAPSVCSADVEVALAAVREFMNSFGANTCLASE